MTARLVLDRLRRRLADDGATHAEVAAAVIVARGQSLLDRERFARRLGVPVEHLAECELGHRPAAHLPRRIAELAPEVDWQAAGVLAAEDPADRASRHPSRHRGR